MKYSIKQFKLYLSNIMCDIARRVKLFLFHLLSTKKICQIKLVKYLVVDQGREAIFQFSYFGFSRLGKRRLLYQKGKEIYRMVKCP